MEVKVTKEEILSHPNDYEEGTWTPSLGGNTTYNAQTGTYTKAKEKLGWQPKTTFKELVKLMMI